MWPPVVVSLITVATVFPALADSATIGGLSSPLTPDSPGSARSITFPNRPFGSDWVRNDSRQRKTSKKSSGSGSSRTSASAQKNKTKKTKTGGNTNAQAEDRGSDDQQDDESNSGNDKSRNGTGNGGGGGGNGGNIGGGGGGNGGNNGGQTGGGNGGKPDQNTAICLDQSVLQLASSLDGQNGDGDPGQAASIVDDANFINFCAGKTLTDGKQVKTGSCNGIVMGEIPTVDKMVSTVIIAPAPGEVITPNTDFTVEVMVMNLSPGRFTNPQETYYSAPQTLVNGVVEGHTHITIQDMGGSFAPAGPLDPTRFAFFKGVNDKGDGRGLLSADVAGGLPSGVYRVCTLSSAGNHQPVLMPVAQRGAQDDCTKFVVGTKAESTG